VFAFGALEHADVETYAVRHDTGERHLSTASRAGGALDVYVDAIGQRMRFWHDASLKEGGSATLSVIGMCL
jgi:hypothetical protein